MPVNSFETYPMSWRPSRRDIEGRLQPFYKALAAQLIEDIETHQENFDQQSQDNYFFGAILIAQESGEDHEVTLIDGQQRTTTFMLCGGYK